MLSEGWLLMLCIRVSNHTIIQRTVIALLIYGSTFIHSLSSSFGDELLQVWPKHIEHMAVQSKPALRQEHFFPHPVLHPQETIRSMDFEATGLSVHMGMRTPSLQYQPQSVGSKERPNHCCTVRYTRYDRYLAAADVGGKLCRWKAVKFPGLLFFFLFMNRKYSMWRQLSRIWIWIWIDTSQGSYLGY